MKVNPQEKLISSEDDFWTTHLSLFTAQFPSDYTKPQKVRGKFHSSEEPYFAEASEIIPLKHKEGMRTYVMMHPYVLEPNLTLTVGLYKKPKQYADQKTAIGETLGNAKQEGFREAQVGEAQAWYYHEDKIIVLWECFFDHRFRRHPLAEDENMQKLWHSFEHFLKKQFPNAKTLATPFNDPIAKSIEEYQSFLQKLDYSPIAKAAFGKSL